MIKKTVIRLMNNVGYFFDELGSGKDNLCFCLKEPTAHGIDTIYFKTWKEAGDWAFEHFD